MVNVDEAIIAKLEKNGKNFEILVDCEKALAFREGKLKDINEVLATQDIFDDVKKGQHASNLKEVFGTEDATEISKIIIKKGEIQLTTEHKNKIREEIKNRIVGIIHRNAINPQNNLPHPPGRIETAMEEAKVRIDEFKSAEEQVDEVVKKINIILPIKYEIRELLVKIPAQYAGQSFTVVKKYSKVLKDDWQDNGNLHLIVEIPAGIQNDLMDKLNDITKGETEINIVKTK